MSELNLIPYSLKQKKRKKWIVLEVCLAILIAAAVLGIGIYYPFAKLNDLKSQAADLQASVSAQSSVKAQNAKLLSETKTLKETIARADILKKSGMNIYNVMQEMEQYIPGDITITNYNYAAGKLNITAVSKQYNAINEFQANLQESGKYKNVRVTTITSGNASSGSNTAAAGNTSAGWTFTLTIDEVVKGDVKK